MKDMGGQRDEIDRMGAAEEKEPVQCGIMGEWRKEIQGIK
jgi:hypothetical protein